MLLKIKAILISMIYFFSAAFMLLYPPRNFKMSGVKTRSLRSVRDIKFLNYLTVNEIERITSKMVKDVPDTVHVISLKPLTSNNSAIKAIELKSDRKTKKPGLLIIGGLDPMVWAASNAILELAQKLIYDASYQTPYFNDYDWYFIPLANPDGLELTQRLSVYPKVPTGEWSKNMSVRMTSAPEEWHKNVQNTTTTGGCLGIHINRNFAYHWQDDVSRSPDHCSQTYPGERPFSSPEAMAIRKYVDSLGDNIDMAIHLHASFVPKKELILYPWRYSMRQHSNFMTLQNIGEYSARQSRLPDGRLYEVHQSSLDGRVAGSISDYLAGVVGTELVYTLKPYHQRYPNLTDYKARDLYVKKTISVILSLIRGWRSNTKQNTLSFFGREVDF